jgi:hypothetical protein
MKLRCIKTYAMHWGVAFEEGKEYDVSEIIEHPIVVLTDYKRYWDLNQELLTSFQNRQKSKREGIEVVDDEEFSNLQNKNSAEQKLCETKISLPHAVIRSDDKGSIWRFLLSTDEELFQLGVDKKLNGDVAIGPYTVYRIDDHFDFKSERRDKKLKELGI